MSLIREFKEFAVKGNVIDMAVGVILGAAFGKIVSSLVSDVIMPPIGLLLGAVDFSNLFINMSGKAYESLADAKKAGAPTLNYGVFLNTVIEFVIIAFAVFCLVKVINRVRAQLAVTAAQSKPAAPSAEVVLLEEIRDLLKKQRS